MQCYTELTPPTAVTHSLSLPFVSAESNNLIVAKTSLLQIFSTKTISFEVVESSDDEKSAKQNGKFDRIANDDEGHESSFLGPESIPRPPVKSSRTKLVLVAEYSVSGTITSLARIKTEVSKSGGESLLVGFKDAKLSLVEWDPERPGISTTSIHYYEQDDYQGTPWTVNTSDSINYLAADPGNRCAALKFGARNVAILPMKQGDEDVNMDDWEEEIDGPRPDSQSASKITNGEGDKADTPYAPSYVLRLPKLDPNLIYPIHLAFLYEYREPTFGILSSNQFPSSSLLHVRKDHVSYMVFTLDLEQRAVTTILSVTDLPFDLFKIVPLPTPVGGALLVGGNELIHIDQAGKSNGIAVNPFAKLSTNFSLKNQADLDMRLESCQIEQLSIENGEMLIILQNGALAILSFEMDGRSVSGVKIRRVAQESGGNVMMCGASTVSRLASNSVFIGSEGTDAVVLGWSRKSNQVSKRRSRLDFISGIDESLLDDEDEDEDDDDPDDELYGATPAFTQTATNPADSTSSKAGDYVFRIHDSLVNLAPMVDIVLGSSSVYEDDADRQLSDDVRSDLQMVAVAGKDRGGSLAVMHKNIRPKVMGKFEFAEARGLWTTAVKRSPVKGLQISKDRTATSGDYSIDAEYDRLMIVSKQLPDSEESSVYILTDTGFEELVTPEYEKDGATIEVGTLGNGMRIIQVVKTQLRAYDGDLGLAQILEMEDELTGAEPNIVSASFADPFMLLIRDDASIFVVKCDDSYDLEEVERVDDVLLTTEWLTGCLYVDNSSIFSETQSDKGKKEEENIMMFLLSAGGALYIYALPDLTKAVYVAEGLCFVPPVLSADYAARRSAARQTLTEIIVADLGDTVAQSPYLILRPSGDDLTIYEPFRTKAESAVNTLSSSLHFLKIHNPHLAQSPGVSAEEAADEGGMQTQNEPMRAIANVGGYSAVFLLGASPAFILKSAKSTPKVIDLQGVSVRGMSSFHTSGCERGFIYADTEGITRVAQLPENTNFTELGISLQKIPLNENVHALAYHPKMNCYVVGTSTRKEFELPKDEDHRREWKNEDVPFKPTMEQGYLRLMNPVNWSIIDTIEMDLCEMIMCVKTLNLEVSETTNERRQLITVGTAISKGEDLAIKGRLYVYDVVSVVPRPDRPETSKKMKLIAREDIPRGAITGVSEIGTQGFMLVAQGQKCMVRGLKEDGTLLPVAFMDMNCYVTAVKELRGTGLCLLADAIKGLWFVGYTEEPYKMMLFGKSQTRMEIMAADLLPDGEELFIVAADANCTLHIMQYDPEHPKSLQGHLLLHRTTFSLGGHLPTTMTLLPRTTAPSILFDTSSNADAAAEATIPSHQLLITSTTGSIAVLSTLSEPQYRRLSTLSSHLANTLYHACGLNPRAYRVDRNAPEGMMGGRAIVDGGLLMRWMELGSQRRSEVAGRVGVDVEEVREDLVQLMGGLGYL
ncbi:CPSF A subunit region-domain-containing protein [Amylocarpus encephaloides]|uniref:Protein CFT1 n=1 Tax=Amylocarpus encephaloides TaxID=45428 RepID=A0A9P7YCV9_9HELO|nr:CPSF A subunit region-domain-containing protein [Amylocarpus encephaloides]